MDLGVVKWACMHGAHSGLGCNRYQCVPVFAGDVRLCDVNMALNPHNQGPGFTTQPNTILKRAAAHAHDALGPAPAQHPCTCLCTHKQAYSLAHVDFICHPHARGITHYHVNISACAHRLASSSTSAGSTASSSSALRLTHTNVTRPWALSSLVPVLVLLVLLLVLVLRRAAISSWIIPRAGVTCTGEDVQGT